MGTLLITGGAGFIGSNLVHHALADTADRLVVVDKLTYAGSLLNLEAALHESARHVRARRHRGSRRRWRACSRSIGRTRCSTSPPRRTSIARSTARGRSSTRTSSAPSCCSRRRGRFVAGARRRRRASAFRFLHVSTDEVYGTLGADGHVQRGDAVRAELAVRGQQGGGRSPRARRTSTPTACRR